MLAGSGQWLLMADADGATKFAELVQLKRLASELVCVESLSQQVEFHTTELGDLVTERRNDDHNYDGPCSCLL